MKYIVANLISDLVRAYKVEAIETFTLTKMGTKIEKAQTKTRYHVEDCCGSMIIEGKDVIKEADTMEELCDGIIFKDTKANKLSFLNMKDRISILGAALFVETVRGFVETDRGLIYIAKMNEEKKWELL